MLIRCYLLSQKKKDRKTQMDYSESSVESFDFGKLDLISKMGRNNLEIFGQLAAWNLNNNECSH